MLNLDTLGIVADKEPKSAVPPFPRLSAEQSVRLTRVAKFRAWSGRVERLVRLEHEIESALEKVYDKRVAEMEPFDEAKARADAEELRVHVSVTSAGGRVQRVGPITSILAEMDTREIRTVSMGNSASRTSTLPQISVNISGDPNADTQAVTLTVRGDDRQWVGGVVDLLSGELAKTDPKWSIMRTYPVAILGGLLLSYGAAGIWAYLSQDAARVIAGGWFIFFLLPFIGLMGGLLLVRSVLVRAFPPLEILEAGESSRARRSIAGVTTAVSMLLGVAGVVLGVIAL